MKEFFLSRFCKIWMDFWNFEFWPVFMTLIQMRILTLVGEILIWLLVRCWPWVLPFSKPVWMSGDADVASFQRDEFPWCFWNFSKSSFLDNWRFVDFSWVQACLDVDIARCKCDIDMVDGALEWVDLTFSKHGMFGFDCVGLRRVRNGFQTPFSRFFQFFSNFFECAFGIPNNL